MSRILYLTDDVLSAVCLRDNGRVPPGDHLTDCWPEGRKAEPLVSFSTGTVTGYEFLSQLPAGMNSESFFSQQLAVVNRTGFLGD